MIAAERVVVVVQARTSSRRMPGKVLAPLAGLPAIARMMERVARVTRAAHRVVATSADASDDGLARLCRDLGLRCSRGPLEDVLGRFVSAVPAGCDTVVRLTGDCPLIDPVLVDRHIERFAEAPADYVTNAVVRTYPDGLDVEVVSQEWLAQADREATTPADREHVTPWVQRHARVVHLTQEVDLSALRLVLDTPADYACLSAIYAALHAANSAFDTGDVYRLLVQRPELILLADGSPVPDMRERLRAYLEQETRS